ncbi:YkvA family protein [Mesobacillus subterraneus]|uniref:YkvA family protein n=1 Tax=Mesobacillus subterraneus TaxID=285983 RepID=UPI00203AE87E|nr:YkvA family protein [Mesobacillus subterraneus]MCM3663158.1 YkvA family protein [Mesobacillus subterraneus]MCM3682667.1 YkvA family protein [Mesobacillus subterraneus]
MLGTKKIEQGYKKFEAKAKEYVNRPEKTDVLLKDASKKADDKKGSLSEIWDNLQLLFDLVGAWRRGEYRKIPTGSIVTIIAAIIYFVSPIDLVPDFLMGLGIIDDAAVIGFVLKQLTTDLEKFKSWKENYTPENVILEEKLPQHNA